MKSGKLSLLMSAIAPAGRLPGYDTFGPVLGVAASAEEQVEFRGAVAADGEVELAIAVEVGHAAENRFVQTNMFRTVEAAVAVSQKHAHRAALEIGCNQIELPVAVQVPDDDDAGFAAGGVVNGPLERTATLPSSTLTPPSRELWATARSMLPSPLKSAAAK